MVRHARGVHSQTSWVNTSRSIVHQYRYPYDTRISSSQICLGVRRGSHPQMNSRCKSRVFFYPTQSRAFWRESVDHPWNNEVKTVSAMIDVIPEKCATRIYETNIREALHDKCGLIFTQAAAACRTAIGVQTGGWPWQPKRYFSLILTSDHEASAVDRSY